MPADERLRDALEGLAPEPPAHERAEALVVARRPRGSTRSSAMRSLPGQEKSDEARNGPERVGRQEQEAFGQRVQPAARTTKVRALPSSRADQPRPRRRAGRHSASAHGFSVMNESAPASMRNPSRALGARSCRRAARAPRAASARARRRARAPARRSGARRRARRCRRRRRRASRRVARGLTPRRADEVGQHAR